MLLFLSMLGSDADKEKFVRIYEKYRYFLWYLANERLHDTHLAEDAVQEAFLALTRHMDKVGEVESVATRNFLATIVKGKAVDLLRKQRHRAEVEFTEWAANPASRADNGNLFQNSGIDDLEGALSTYGSDLDTDFKGGKDACSGRDSFVIATDGDPLEAWLVQENYEQILKCVRNLDEIYRVVFEYKYLHELSDREIADLLEITPKNVNVRIFRARKKLQEMLADDSRQIYRRSGMN